MFILPTKILDRHITPAGGEATFTFDLGNLVTQWDAQEGITSRHLVLIVNAASEDAVAQRDVVLRFNGDDGANYGYQTLKGEGAGPATAPASGAATVIEAFSIPGTNYANSLGGGEVVIPDAFGGNTKTSLSLGGSVEDEVEIICGRWVNVAAITSITLLPNMGLFAAGSEFSIGVIDERYLLEEVILAADSPVHFRNITQGDGDLVVVAVGRSAHNTFDNLDLALNNDILNANYSRMYLLGSAGAASASGANDRRIGALAGDDNPTYLSPFILSIYQYTKENQPFYTSISGRDATVIQVYSGRRLNNEPVHTLTLLSQLDAANALNTGCIASLYRIPKRVIDRQVLTEDAATITFADIPQYFEALRLNVYARTDNAGNRDSVLLSFNADFVAANYDEQELAAFGAAVLVSRNVSRAAMMVAGDTLSADGFGGGSILVPGYTRTDSHKHRVTMSGSAENIARVYSSRWNDMDAVTRIDLAPGIGPNFIAGSVFELEGILRKEGLPASAGMSIGVPI